MKPTVARTALLTLAAGILTGGALALSAAPAAAAPENLDVTPGLVAMAGDDSFDPVVISPSNPSGN